MKRVLIVMFALVLIGSFAFAQDNEVTITQLTSDNSASVDQSGEENEATILQTGGKENVAKIEQSSKPDEDGIIISTITQNGWRNNASVVGTRKNNSSSETVQTQIGNDNRARINQGASLGTNRGTTLTQIQQGHRNFATMTGSDSYKADQRQYGNDNDARTSGLGKNADVYQYQNGNDNIARLNGDNFGYAASEQKQFGDNNLSILDQVGHDGPGESYFTLQNGYDNIARLNANGFGGVLDIRQTGNLNKATVDWTTELNTAIITQNGFENTAVVNSN